jgi:hypothetical protein
MKITLIVLVAIRFDWYLLYVMPNDGYKKLMIMVPCYFSLQMNLASTTTMLFLVKWSWWLHYRVTSFLWFLWSQYSKLSIIVLLTPLSWAYYATPSIVTWLVSITQFGIQSFNSWVKARLDPYCKFLADTSSLFLSYTFWLLKIDSLAATLTCLGKDDFLFLLN